MTRLARSCIPGQPHHVTQRGNGRAQTFFSENDYRTYRDMLGRYCRNADVAVWARALMPNHVHLILVPADADADGLRSALALLHAGCAGYAHMPAALQNAPAHNEQIIELSPEFSSLDTAVASLP